MIYAFTITRATTPQRLDMLRSTLEEGRGTAGMEFKWVVHCLTSKSFELVSNLATELKLEAIFHSHNIGQHVITNLSIKAADDGGYDKLLRLDDDVKFLTKRWLFKLNEASDKLGPTFIVSPRVLGLNNLPDSSEVISHEGINIQVLLNAIGGICRLHYLESLTNPVFPYISDVRKPLGFGDATGIAEWCKQNLEHGLRRWMAYIVDIRIKHAYGTTKQQQLDPVYHEVHNLYQVVPYIPIWDGKV